MDALHSSSNPRNSGDHDPFATPVSKIAAIVLVLAVVALIGLTARRVHQNYSVPAPEFDWSTRGHSDFHNGIYFPSIAFREQVNPYSMSVMEHYTVAAPSRACPPVTFMIHLPFGLMDLKVADIAFFVFNVGMLLGLAFVAVQFCHHRPAAIERADWRSFPWLIWLAVCTVLLVSRPGHVTLFTGYYTLELVLGTVFSLHFAKNRPWISAIGVLVASSKPTYVLPLLILMIARKNYQATWRGVLLCVIFGVIGLGWIAQKDGFTSVFNGIQEGQAEFHGDESEYPINTWTRIDLVGMAAKAINWIPDDKAHLGCMVLLLVVPCVVIYRVADGEFDDGILGLTGQIALLTILLAIYHHSYDCLLVVVPWVGFIFFGDRVLPEVGRPTKWLLGLLLSVPLLNYLSTKTGREILEFDQLDMGWQLITVINGMCLLIALIILMTIACRSLTTKAQAQNER